MFQKQRHSNYIKFNQNVCVKKDKFEDLLNDYCEIIGSGEFEGKCPLLFGSNMNADLNHYQI